MKRVSILPALSAAAILSFTLSGCSSAANEQVEIPASAHSLSPAADIVYECLVDKGWTVSITWDGGIQGNSNDIPAEQMSVYDEDSAECWSVIEERVAAYGPEEIAKVYDLEIASRECLIEQGVNVEDPPSEQQYLDTFHGERWMAYGASDIDAVAQDQDRYKQIAQACPQPSWSLGTEG